jgi:ribulose-phosphate 3-epimerase
MTRTLTLTASILSLDPSLMKDEVADVAQEIDAVQLDIMDGRFVENSTYGPEIVASVGTPLPLDVHLMVVDPENWIQGFIDAGARHVTFHAEAVPERADQERLVAAIRAAGCTAGIAINPTTPFDAIQTDVDMVLCMTVWPGKGGQAFIDDVLPKIRAIRALRPDLSIQVDGGVNEETAKACIVAGADNLVIGSALFKAADRSALLSSIRHAAS